MTVREIKAIVLKADPDAKHYNSPHDGTDYTVWMEYKRTGVSKDNRSGKGWLFQIDRWTKTEYDPVAELIEQVLDDAPDVAYNYMVNYEQDSGYIRHMFDCEGY